jgi:hypothetical protein
VNKTVDVDLRIRAKNLSKATLSEINSDVEQLANLQGEYASSAKFASQMQYLKAAQRELTRRGALAQSLKEDQEAIRQTADRIDRLTAAYKSMQQRTGKEDNLGPLMKKTQVEIESAQRTLESLVVSARKSGDQLKAMGVDVSRGEAAFSELSGALADTNAAYAASVGNIDRYNSAVKETAAVSAEAQRRLDQETAAAKRRNAAVSEAVGRKNEAAVLRADIELRSRAARETEIQAEATRRLIAESSREQSVRDRNNAAIRETIGRMNELQVMRAQARNTLQSTIAAQEQEAAAMQRANARREALVRLLNTERGQRILTAEALRRHNRNNAAVDRGNRGLGLLADTGRKSLSVYQRIRGQVLGMAAAYIGVYEAVNTVSKAIQATSRNQALRVGLLTVNNNDSQAAASDYEFLRKEIDRLGLVFDDVAPKFANMAVAGKSVGLTGRQIRDTFSDVATSRACSARSCRSSARPACRLKSCAASWVIDCPAPLQSSPRPTTSRSASSTIS